ncbi:hypothetical protein [Actinophytocola gossypii]|uniref:Integral membrane protein n=1 Tax=Actinophytocola gossypii TaxID=2812003 RepID=A0ABT2JB18_9PSEU|nr:hypothetical protein [Actinophytocola gossypii]MCT2585037.1 hypothetical protein [Actinophytocola gossypii]
MGELFETLSENPLAVAIVLCEVGFWVVLAGGLVARYLLRLRRTSAVLLVSTPLLDLALLVITVVDLRGGGEASAVHGLGAAYLGFSVAFGHSLIRWADQRFAHRFAGGPPPVKPPKRGPARLAHEWREWGKCVLACAIACAVMALLSFVVGTPERTEALWQPPGGWMPRLGIVTAIWFVAGPLWTLLSSGTRDYERDRA